MKQILITLTLAVSLTVFWSLTHGADVDQAKKEGALVLYASMSAPEIAKLTGEFAKKYPFIKVDTFRSNNERILSRILTEGAAGKFFADIVLTDTVSGWALKQKDYLQIYKSKETDAYPKQFRDPDGYFACCVYVITNVIAYNTNATPKSEIPQSYADLLNPRLKGKLGMEDEDVEWFNGLISVWGKERTTNYFRSLMKQEPSMRKGHALLAQLTGAGEVQVAVNTLGFRILEMQQQGVPIEIVNADPVVAAPRYVTLAKKAPHPNAAQLFADYVLSNEGQHVIASGGRTIIRPSVQSKYDRLVKGIQLHPVKPEMSKDYEEAFKLFHSLTK